MKDLNLARAGLIQFDIRTTRKKTGIVLTKHVREGDQSITVIVEAGLIKVMGDASFYRADLPGKTPVNDGAWHRVRIEKDGPAVRAWVDGRVQGSINTLPTFQSDSSWMLNLHAPWGSTPFDAEIGNIWIVSK